MITLFLICLVAAFCVYTAVTNNHDMPTTRSCKSEKVLVNGYPVLINEEGFDLSTLLSVTLFYDNVAYNYCPPFAAKLSYGSCRVVTTEIKSINLTLARSHDNYEISKSLYALKGTTISYNITPVANINITETGCAYFYLYSCNNVSSCDLIAAQSSTPSSAIYVKDYCHHTLKVNTTISDNIIINQTAFYYISMRNDAKTDVEVNVELNITKYDTKPPFVMQKGMCPKEAVDVEKHNDSCSSTSQKLYVFVESPHIGEVVYQNCTTKCHNNNENNQLQSFGAPTASGMAGITAITAIITALISVCGQIILKTRGNSDGNSQSTENLRPH